MKHFIKILVFLALYGLSNTGGYAQDTLPEIEPVESVRLLVPKLEILIDSALSRNGMLGYRKEEIEVKKANLKEKRRNWTRNFGLQGDTRYGTFDNFSNNTSGSTSFTLASTNTQTNYGVGFYLKIPVYDIFNRKSEIKQAKSEITQAEKLVTFQEDEIKETVIRYYEDLLLKENLLEIQAINLSDARVNKEMAKKEFTNGQLELYEYIRISDITAGVNTEYEKAKSNLMLAKKLLENLTGVQIY